MNRSFLMYRLVVSDDIFKVMTNKGTQRIAYDEAASIA